jgi:predicted ATPase
MRRLTMCGPPLLALEHAAIPFAAERRFQLLSFLAHRGDWVSRDQLTALFWAEFPAAAARRNLRGLLFDLRQLRWLDGLETRSDSVRWLVDSDRQEFEAHLGGKRWGAAVALVRGTFLDGMEINATAAFADWLRFERQWLLDRWRDAVDQHLASLAGDRVALVDAAQSALTLDPLNEHVVAALLVAHAETGNLGAAQRAFDAYSARLARDIGVEPPARLRAHLDALRERRAWSPAPATDTAGEASRSFIGRRVELRALADQLRRADCRRVNVLGPGGIGKSSLARAVLAWVGSSFPGGAYWIDLREIGVVSQVAAQIADRIGLELRSDCDAWTQIHERLREARALLVLDNCEHLHGLGDIAEQLLAACPRLKILLTSRLRLGGRSEWVFPLAGLPVPDEDEAELAAVRSFDAVRLFEARAFAVAPAFELGASAQDVARLVRAVEGLPLAIELAASCVRLMPVRHILDQLIADATALDATAAGVAAIDAERGLRASFQHSWRLLGAAEQQALAQLAVFAGAFDRVAAEQVAHAALPVLAALVDKSLLRPTEHGGLSLHPLIQHFALRQLPDDRPVRTRHAEYCARDLALRLHSAGADRQRRIETSLPDAVAAWRWCCACGAAALIAQLAAPLMQACDLTGRWSEGLEHFRLALDRLGHRPDELRARAEVTRALALLHYRRGEFDAAEQRARESLRLATSSRTLRGVDGCLNVIGAALRQRGQWQEAHRFFERALRSARASGRTDLELRIGNNIASVEMATGDPQAAIRRCEALLQVPEATSDRLGRAMTLVILGNGNLSIGRQAEAQRWYEQGLAIAEAHGLVTLTPFFLQALGTCHRLQGRNDQAHDLYRRTLASPRECLEPQLEIFALLGLARLEVSADADRAADFLRQALALATQARSPAWQATVIAGWGDWFAQQGQVERAATLLAFAANCRAIDAMDGREAAARLAAIELTDAQRATCVGRAAHLTVGDLVAELSATPST